ncbi:MAG: TIGR03118 family protein [Acidimicrobiales bacterium]
MTGATPPPNDFTQTDLVANNASFGAKLVDPNLTNPWGVASNSGGPLWVSDNNSGKVTVYGGGVNGSPVSLDLTVPVPGGNPTGQVANTTSSFPVGGSSGSPAAFIVATDSIGSTQSPGEIAAWDGGSSFVVEDSPTGGPGGTTPANAVFKGLAEFVPTTGAPRLYATDVANARVDVFSSTFAPVSSPTAFQDPAIPAGYTPFGIQELGGLIYVTYGLQNSTKTNVVRGAGLGFVDVYKPDGTLLHHLVGNGPDSPLNAPWGMAIAPSGFGPFSGSLLVGNLGNGWINAFSPTTGKFRGTLDEGSYPVAISGLWNLSVGNTSFGGSNAIVFTAGPNNYADGILGTLTPTNG